MPVLLRIQAQLCRPTHYTVITITRYVRPLYAEGYGVYLFIFA